MRSREFGPTGRRVPVVGQGSWTLERFDRPRAIAAVHAGLDAGLTHVDTAEMYGDGRAEEILGEALRGRRDEVFLVSKVLPENATRAGTVAACERSLARLATDRLDCYLLHWAGPHPLEATFAAFEELVVAGKTLSWGVSNFDAAQLESAVALAGAGRIACNQVLYHPASRGIERELLPACVRHDVALVGYSPFAQGKLPGPGSTGGDALAEVAAAHGATPHAVALAFLVRAEGTFTIPMTSRDDHARANAAAGALDLAPDEIARLEVAFPLPSPQAPLDTA